MGGEIRGNILRKGGRDRITLASISADGVVLPQGEPRDRRGARGIPRISVIIPARNEARNLPYVFTRLPRDVYEVILVDGHSTDGTVDAAKWLRPDVTIIEQRSTGKGGALDEGVAACSGDIIVLLDADGSADPAEIPRFVSALLLGADLAKGSRYLSGGGSADLTWLRSLGNRALTSLVNLLFRTRFSDLCYGYNAFWADCLPYLNLTASGFEIETLVNIRAAKAQLVIHEVPSVEGSRVHGLSNLRAIPDGWGVLKSIMQERTTPPVMKKDPPPPPQTGYGWNGIERRDKNRRYWESPENETKQGRRASDKSVLPPTHRDIS